jgi:pimeloyl-ACP methyl ester carboxylesterase
MPRAGAIYYRDVGRGEPPIVHLHGGWGYEFYPLDHAIAGIARRFVIADRTGYGQSRPPRRTELPIDFHAMYADETEAFLRAIGIERCVLWGHSDGAVIAVHLAGRHPERYAGVVLEALHIDRVKPRSREFFTNMAHNPEAFGDRVIGKLAAEHGDDWRTIIRAGGQAWLAIAATPERDIFDGNLARLSAVPTLVLHGADDPRTEPGELDRLHREVPGAEVHVIAGAGHAPHAERSAAAECTRLVSEWLTRCS